VILKYRDQKKIYSGTATWLSIGQLTVDITVRPKPKYKINLGWKRVILKYRDQKKIYSGTATWLSIGQLTVDITVRPKSKYKINTP
jgi:hypothetical protein